MKLHFSNEWLMKKIATDPESDPQAGAPSEPKIALRATQAGTAATLGERTGVRMRIALGVFVRQLRMDAGLSVAVLAQKAQVSEDELRLVEHDPHYTARPRLIHQLSEYFSVPLAMLSQMSGVTHEVDRILYNESVRFAAHSDDTSKLTKEERTTLHAFISLLHERAKAQ